MITFTKPTTITKAAPLYTWGPALRKERKNVEARLSALVAQRDAAERKKKTRAALEAELDSLQDRAEYLRLRIDGRVAGEDVAGARAELGHKETRIESLRGDLAELESIARETLELQRLQLALKNIEAEVDPAKLSDEDLAAEQSWLPEFVSRCKRDCVTHVRLNALNGNQEEEVRVYYGSERDEVRSEIAQARKRLAAVEREHSRRVWLRNYPDLIDQWEEFRRRQDAFRTELARLAPEALALNALQQQLLQRGAQLNAHGSRIGEKVPQEFMRRTVNTVDRRFGHEARNLD